ncbi:MAG: hypothetical protein NkDv07_0292 [Candidatus Improbicoccus devescovinae]|nr:MAG: hypothetical protein NkDv07_0292 [Candidatus Improbicoccus devescovinae]
MRNNKNISNILAIMFLVGISLSQGCSRISASACPNHPDLAVPAHYVAPDDQDEETVSSAPAHAGMIFRTSGRDLNRFGWEIKQPAGTPIEDADGRLPEGQDPQYDGLPVVATDVNKLGQRVYSLLGVLRGAEKCTAQQIHEAVNSALNSKVAPGKIIAIRVCVCEGLWCQLDPFCVSDPRSNWPLEISFVAISILDEGVPIAPPWFQRTAEIRACALKHFDYKFR